jgi:hypothetical protein
VGKLPFRSQSSGRSADNWNQSKDTLENFTNLEIWSFSWGKSPVLNLEEVESGSSYELVQVIKTLCQFHLRISRISSCKARGLSPLSSAA